MRTILYLVTEDWYFVSHRLPLAEAALKAGYRVVVATRVQSHGERIRAAGCELVPIGMDRGGRNPWSELRSLWELVGIYRSIRPDIAHHVALKPVLYGTIAGSITGVPAIVNALAGLGYVFTGSGGVREGARFLIRPLFRLLFNRPRVLVLLQNPDDRNLLIDAGVLRKERTALIRGSGVDLEQFPVRPVPPGPPVVILPARMLWDKGVGEFVEAARRLRARGVEARFVLVGGRDPANPAAIPAEVLDSWQREGVIEWWGHRDDMPEVFSQSAIVCLPSYREGLPKALLEAAAAGRPVVTTDVPGCREVVQEGVNGYLVLARDPAALADALARLIDHPERCEELGARGRLLVEQEFSVTRVVEETLRLYQRLLP